MSGNMRVLVLAGVVSLANPLGSVSGGPGQLLAAEPDNAPVNHAVKANADFAVDLYKRLAGENAGKNMFFSPYSVSKALTLVAEGARGATAEEIGKVLRLPEAARRTGAEARQTPWDTSLFHQGMESLDRRIAAAGAPVPPEVRERFAKLRAELDAANHETAKGNLKSYWNARKVADKLDALQQQYEQYELRVANAVWAAKDFPVRPEFADMLKDRCGTGAARNLDIAADPDAARRVVNEWCAERTGNRIKDVLPPGAVDRDTRMILTNAVYFLGRWAEPFAARETADRTFHTTSKTSVTAPFLGRNQSGEARYAAFGADGNPFVTPDEVAVDDTTNPKHAPGEGGVQVLELPYKGGEIAMTFVVPSSVDGLAALEMNLTSQRLSEWTTALKKRTVNVGLPKFRFETSYPDMKATLAAMGMPSAFSREAADFSGISPAPGLSIGSVFHTAHVSVDEKGTEAAAVTAIEIDAFSEKRMVPYVPTVRADRPFLFVIRDVKTGTILFMGRVTDPTAK